SLRCPAPPRPPPSFPTRRSSDLSRTSAQPPDCSAASAQAAANASASRCATAVVGRRSRHSATKPASSRDLPTPDGPCTTSGERRSEEHTSELQSRENLVCRLLLE